MGLQQEAALLKPDMLEPKFLLQILKTKLQTHFKGTERKTANTRMYDPLRYLLFYFAHEGPQSRVSDDQ